MFVVVGMLMPAAYARAPQAGALRPAMVVVHTLADGERAFTHDGKRSTAESLGRRPGDKPVTAIYATHSSH